MAVLIKENEEPPIKLTEKAVEQVELAMVEDNMDLQKNYLRCGIVGGGCAGLQFSLDFSENPNEYDFIFSQKNIKIVVDCISMMYLEGVSIDFVITGFQSGFKFNFPETEDFKNLKQCGCGSSFSI